MVVAARYRPCAGGSARPDSSLPLPLPHPLPSFLLCISPLSHDGFLGAGHAMLCHNAPPTGPRCSVCALFELKCCPYLNIFSSFRGRAACAQHPPTRLDHPGVGFPTTTARPRNLENLFKYGQHFYTFGDVMWDMCDCGAGVRVRLRCALRLCGALTSGLVRQRRHTSRWCVCT